MDVHMNISKFAFDACLKAFVLNTFIKFLIHGALVASYLER